MQRRWLSLTLTGLLLSAAAHAAPTVVAGTSAAIEIPPGFQQLFPYELDNPRSHATIAVTEIPAPFPQLRAQMSDHRRLAQLDVKVLHTEKVTVSGHEGLLQLERRGTKRNHKEAWRLGLGDLQQSLSIEAIFPVDAPSSVRDELRTALLSVTWRQESPDAKFEGLHFRIKESSIMKIAEHSPNGIVLRPNVAPVPDPAPILVMGEMTLPGGELEQVSGQLLRNTKQLTEIGNVHAERLKVGRLAAYEITAEGHRAGDRLIESIYQLVVYDPDQQRAYVAAGVMGRESAGRYMREFQDVGRSVTPKP
jgi:hypothetical protein